MSSVKISADTTQWERDIAKMTHIWEGSIDKMQKSFIKMLGPIAALHAFQRVVSTLVEANKELKESVNLGVTLKDFKIFKSLSQETGVAVEEMAKHFKDLPEYIQKAINAQRQSRSGFGKIEQRDLVMAEGGGSIETVKKSAHELLNVMASITVYAGRFVAGLGLAVSGARQYLSGLAFSDEGQKNLGTSLLAEAFFLNEPDDYLRAQLNKSLQTRLASNQKRNRDKKSVASSSRRDYEDVSSFSVRALDDLNRMGGFSQRGASPSDERVDRIAIAAEKTAENTASLKE